MSGRIVETPNDYATKALVNTINYSDSVTYKANDLLEKKIIDVSGVELRVSCTEQSCKSTLKNDAIEALVHTTTLKNDAIEVL